MGKHGCEKKSETDHFIISAQALRFRGKNYFSATSIGH